MRVLDVCSAPGSKSFSIAEYMNNEGEILSCDISAEKIKKIRDGADRLGLSIINAKENDAMEY